MGDFEKRLYAKEIRYPINLAASVASALFAAVVLYLIPRQTTASATTVVDGSSFPRLLMYVIIACSLALAFGEIVKIVQKQEVKYKSLNLLIEIRAFSMFLLFIGFYLINSITRTFVIGACFVSLGFLIFFKCKRKKYYIIVICSAFIIWMLFTHVLNVGF